ncbi:MAG: hypothetical protein EPO51_26315 [Phenylobacterium sp.]|uniref:ArnT family glycosyltransferase n=1 Tax=Phenylobacterium sp. TaxID=1871053 RepID=UPI001222B940|nr:hypothetical protein [Phenylobacterium sp.]TAJ68409.1 MAG: hypothetical protein EPO51_26315 [Phenylobacterium sp.]
MTSPPAPRRASRPARLLAAAVLAAMGAVLLWKLLLFLDRASWAVHTPNELDYGEGIVWQQMRMMSEGQGYAPLTTFPAIVFHYPPVYHWLTWLTVAATGLDDLSAGRTLSIISTLAAAACAGVIASLCAPGSSRMARWICGASAALVSLTCYPVAYWSVLMRVDMVAVAFALGGLCLTMLAMRRPLLIYLAAIAFVASVFTKQTMIAAPGAAFLVLLVLRPGLALRGIGACIVLGLAVLLGLSVATDGQFIQHILGYNINRFSFERLIDIKHRASVHVPYLLLGLVGAGLAVYLVFQQAGSGSLADVRRRISGDEGTIRILIAVAYLVPTTALLILIGKVGSSLNYYIEWFMAGSVMIGIAMRPAADAVFPPIKADGPAGARVNPLVLAPALVIAGALMAPTATKDDGIHTPADRAELATLTRWVAAADRPVISDNMVILRQAGKEVVLEPAIIAELGSTGVYDERQFVRMIQHGEFAFFVTVGGRGENPYESRYNPAVTDAIYLHYPRKVKLAGLTVHLPAEAEADTARP